MHRTGGDIYTRRRDDLVHFTFEDDLTFQTAEVGVVADKIIEFIRVVTIEMSIDYSPKIPFIRSMTSGG